MDLGKKRAVEKEMDAATLEYMQKLINIQKKYNVSDGSFRHILGVRNGSDVVGIFVDTYEEDDSR